MNIFNNMRSIGLGSIATFAGLALSAGDAFSCPSAIDTCLKSANHVKQSLSTTRKNYLGVASAQVGSGWEKRLAYCKVSSTGAQTLEYLTDATTGKFITTQADGKLVNSVSICGGSGAEYLAGAEAYEKEVSSSRTCAGKLLTPVFSDGKGVRASMMGGNDTVKTLAFAFWGALPLSPTTGRYRSVVEYCGNTGNDKIEVLDTKYGPHSAMPPIIGGGEGNDTLVGFDLFGNAETSCSGDSGKDNLDCEECRGGFELCDPKITSCPVVADVCWCDVNAGGCEEFHQL